MAPQVLAPPPAVLVDHLTFLHVDVGQLAELAFETHADVGGFFHRHRGRARREVRAKPHFVLSAETPVHQDGGLLVQRQRKDWKVPVHLKIGDW